MRPIAISIACLILCTRPLYAQHEHERSPYADQAGSAIAALTAQELEDLQTGAGMGLARAAELNHYPGPKHVLELADSLRIAPEQRARIESIRDAMLERAVAIGARIIDAETRLDLRFQHAHADSMTVQQVTAEIARLYGELRFTHLAAHIAVRSVLTARQISEYDRLRGYARPDGG